MKDLAAGRVGKAGSELGILAAEKMDKYIMHFSFNANIVLYLKAYLVKPQ